MLKFTSPSFELDFTGKSLNIVEENHWFNDQFFTKYSFPFDFEVDTALDEALQMITHHNASRAAKTFNGYFQKFGEETSAVLVIERIQGKKAQGKIRYGFEEFPNYDKKLSEFNLERFTLQQPITDFAVARLNQSYPEVNYNFPQVIVDKFDTSSAQWLYFEGILNNYSGGAFLVNEYDINTQEQINRNIMQPLPYLLYVIAQGFADAGLELTGDILTDPEFKDAVIAIISDYYSTSGEGNIEMFLKASEYDSLETVYWSKTVEAGNYTASIVLPDPGVYKIAGNVIMRSDGNWVEAFLLKDNEVTIWGAAGTKNPYGEFFSNIDRNVEVSLAESTATIDFRSQQLPYALIDENQDPEAMILDLTITKIAGYDVDGNLVPTLVSPEEINLQKCVPDMTFGDLLKVVKNWKNYDIKIGNGVAEMNKIQNKRQTANKINLEDYEVKDPIRNFYQDNTFLLQFQDIDSDVYSFAKLFVEANGSKTSSFIKRDDTKEITMNAVPLPMKQQGAVSTAHLFVDNENKLVLTIYPGLLNGLNICRDTSKLLIPEVYQSSWKEWLDFRINSEGFEWTFYTDSETAGKISQDSEVSAYHRDFVVRRVSKKNISGDWWEITLEADGEA